MQEKVSTTTNKTNSDMKTRLLIIIALLSAFAYELSAQDKVYTTDNRVIEAKVLEISEVELIYKAFDNPDGPRYRMPLHKVFKIVFANGSTQVFNEYAQSPFLPMMGDPRHYGHIDYRWGGYYNHYGRLSESMLADYIGVSLYGSEYIRASNQYWWGVGLVGSGAVALIISLGVQLADNDLNNFAESKGMGGSYSSGYIAGYVIGAGCIGAGIPLWVKGSKKLRQIADDYNRNYLDRHYGREDVGSKANLSLGATRSGFGLAFNF